MNEFENRINEFYEDEHGKLWKVVAYCGEPTVSLESVALTGTDRQTLHIGANSPLAQKFTPLGESKSQAIHEYHKQLFDRRR
jgi:hypothetical protein